MSLGDGAMAGDQSPGRPYNANFIGSRKPWQHFQGELKITKSICPGFIG